MNHRRNISQREQFFKYCKKYFSEGRSQSSLPSEPSSPKMKRSLMLHLLPRVGCTFIYWIFSLDFLAKIMILSAFSQLLLYPTLWHTHQGGDSGF
jgi:hypothetical protein